MLTREKFSNTFLYTSISYVENVPNLTHLCFCKDATKTPANPLFEDKRRFLFIAIASSRSKRASSIFFLPLRLKSTKNSVW